MTGGDNSMMKSWTVKDIITILVMAAGLVAWGARLESKLSYHESLPSHPAVHDLVDRRVEELIKVSKSDQAAGMATLITEMRYLRDEVGRLRDDIRKLQDDQRVLKSSASSQSHP